MATATELFESGTGDTVTDRGDAVASRLFHVAVDAPATGRREDPADFVLRNSTGLLDNARNAVPLGSPHPGGDAKDRFGLVAARYTVEEHVSYLNYIVRVDYMEPQFNFGRLPWLFSFSPGFGTRRANNILTTHDPQTGVLLDTPLVVDIGPRIYNVNSEGTYLATVPNTDPDSTGSKIVNLKRDPDGKRRIQGVDVTFPIGTMTLTRTLSSYPEDLHSYVMSLRNMANSTRFLTRPPQRLKFVGPAVASSAAGPNSTSSTGVNWDITLVFEDNEEVLDWIVNGELRHYDFTIQDVHQEAGVEVAIVDTQSDPPNETQVSFYKYYFDYEFANLLGVLNAYA